MQGSFVEVKAINLVPIRNAREFAATSTQMNCNHAAMKNKLVDRSIPKLPELTRTRESPTHVHVRSISQERGSNLWSCQAFLEKRSYPGTVY
jgi:hypothetical protein